MSLGKPIHICGNRNILSKSCSEECAKTCYAEHTICVSQIWRELKGNRTEVMSAVSELLHRKLGKNKKIYRPVLFLQFLEN